MQKIRKQKKIFIGKIKITEIRYKQFSTQSKQIIKLLKSFNSKPI